MEHWKVKCSTAAWRMHSVKNWSFHWNSIVWGPVYKHHQGEFWTEQSHGKKWASFHVRSIWSDGWIRFEMPQATKSEVPISWAGDCLWAQIRPMRTFLSCDSKLNLRLVKIKRKKKGRIRLKNHSRIMRELRRTKWSIPNVKKERKVNNFWNLI